MEIVEEDLPEPSPGEVRVRVLTAGVLLAVTVFIVVGNPLFGFPWQGCV